MGNYVNYAIQLLGLRLCFIVNVVSTTSNLGYVLSTVCMLLYQSASRGLVRSVMTKAISIETALLTSLSAE